MRSILLLVAAALVSAAGRTPACDIDGVWADSVRRSAPLRIGLAGTDDGSAVSCAEPHRCAANPGSAGTCRLAVRLCMAGAGHVTRLTTTGTPSAAGRVGEALLALPGASARAHGVRFAPPLPAGCHELTEIEVPHGQAVRLVVSEGTAGGRRARARVRTTCEGPANPGSPSPPPAPPPPNPPPPPPPNPPGAPLPLRFVRETVDEQGGGQLTSDVAGGDLDGDGAPDIVVSGFLHLLWYHNPDWAPHPIADGAFGRGGKTLVRDMDGDGRPDVVTGFIDPSLPPFDGGLAMVWFRNTPTGWEQHLLSDDVYCHDLLFGDLDGDGRDDGLCLDQQRGKVFRLEPPLDPLAPWTPHTIDDDENAMGSAIADIDGDGRPDVVVGRAWYRNNGDDTWTRHEYTDITVEGYDHFRDYTKVSVLDLDGDGRLDVFATLYAETPAGRVYVFLAPPDPAAGSWTPVLLDAGPLFGVHSQGVGAFDGTSRPQIMVGETGIGGFDFGIAPHPHIYVYRLLGAATDPTAWERAVVDTIGTHEAQVVDLDRDGFPDVIGHQENTQVIGTNGPVNAWRNASGN